MTTDRRFSSTVPAPLDAGMPAAMPVEPQVAPRRMEYEVVGAAATELADVLSALRRAVARLLASSNAEADATRPVLAALAHAEHITMQGRLLAKIASGEIRHQNAAVRLDQLLHEVLRTRVARPGRDAQIQHSIRPVSVVIDQDLAATLLNAALDWAAGEGGHVEVSLDVKDWPAHGLLRLKTSATAPTAASEFDQERLCWHLVTETSRAVGATVDRIRSAGQTLVMVEFARTVRELDGLSSMEVELTPPSASADTAGVLAGHRALIISSDVRLREEIKRICQNMGLVVDSVPSSPLAARHCEHELPDVIVIDERFNDERFADLRSRLLRRQANFPMVEIAYSSDVPMSLEGWGSGGLTRVSRNHVAGQLAQALALEMSKVL